MSRKSVSCPALSGLLCPLLLLGISAGSASAGYITSNGTLAVRANGLNQSPGANPPIDQITEFELGFGQLFTNQVGGAPFAVGSTVRTVGVAGLSAVFGTSGELNTGIVEPLAGSNVPLWAIFAVEGEITSGLPGNPEAKFTEGALWFTAESNLTLADPTTWNFSGAFSQYVLAPPKDILPGSSFGIDGGSFGPIDAFNVNRSEAVVSQTQGDGTVVFREATLRDSFVTNVVTPSGGLSDSDWLVASTSQIFQPDVINLGAAALAELNMIGLAAGFGGAFDEGGFNPTPGGSGSGDFNARFRANVFIATVPEPATIVAFGAVLLLVFGSTLLSHRKRRNGELGECV